MGADVRITWDQVLAWRLARQGVGGAAGVPSDPVGLVAHLAGVQAQVESSAAPTTPTRSSRSTSRDRRGG